MLHRTIRPSSLFPGWLFCAGWMILGRDELGHHHLVYVGGSGGASLEVAVEGCQMTKKGLRKLGSVTVDADGGKTPGAAMEAAAFIATPNRVRLIVGTGAKLYGEHTGSAKVEGRAKDTAKEIGEQLKTRFQSRGWIN